MDRRDVAGVRALARERRVTTVVDLLACTNADTEPLWNALRGEVMEEPAPSDSPIAGLDLRYLLRVDSRAFRRVHGWSEPTPLEVALRETIADEKERG